MHSDFNGKIRWGRYIHFNKAWCLMVQRSGEFDTLIRLLGLARKSQGTIQTALAKLLEFLEAGLISVYDMCGWGRTPGRCRKFDRCTRGGDEKLPVLHGLVVSALTTIKGGFLKLRFLDVAEIRLISRLPEQIKVRMLDMKAKLSDQTTNHWFSCHLVASGCRLAGSVHFFVL